MGKLGGLLGVGIGLAVEVSKSRKHSPAEGQSGDFAVHAKGYEDYNEDRSPKQQSGTSSLEWQPKENEIGQNVRDSHQGNRNDSKQVFYDEGSGESRFENETYDSVYSQQRLCGGTQHEWWENVTEKETADAGEPPSYSTVTQSTEINSPSRVGPGKETKESSKAVRGSESQKGIYGPSSEAGINRDASLHPKFGGGLELPIIVPQRRPEDKSRGWMLCYAPMLESCGISQTEFLEFLTAFNKSSKSSPYLDVVNVAAMGVGFVPGVAPLVVSMVVPMAVKAAKTAQTNSQTKTYLGHANESLFSPRGLFAMVVTFEPDSASKTVSVDTSSPSDSIRQYAANQFNQGGSSSDGNGTIASRAAVELPKSAPLVFPSATELSTQPKTGFSRTLDVAADYFDRRARVNYATQHPEAQSIVGPSQGFASAFGNPNSAAHSGGLKGLLLGGLTQSTHSNDNRDDDRDNHERSRNNRSDRRRHSRDRDDHRKRSRDRSHHKRHSRDRDHRRSHSSDSDEDSRDDNNRDDRGRDEDNRGGLLSAAKAKMMKKDMLYLMIVNIPSGGIP